MTFLWATRRPLVFVSTTAPTCITVSVLHARFGHFGCLSLPEIVFCDLQIIALGSQRDWIFPLLLMVLRLSYSVAVAYYTVCQHAIQAEKILSQRQPQ